jgi:hypothetical protein
MARNGTLKAEDALFLALATGQNVREAAKTAGIGERTAHRRCDDPAFLFHVCDVNAGKQGIYDGFDG